MITINIQSRSEIKKLKVELAKIVKDKENLNHKKVINKSQELDKKIVSFMKWIAK
ncbi:MULTISPECIES: aspartyl-phosphate phosphatase Spo0E family protein [unclassified Candidatus Frackibacter]|uniref:aspartyl-phosphate phosphatase Spo0E family protein n=1 Tax=unclassified Candidatus Frackibacter TaxID=2648818 RepID=UPI0015A30613|nr:MULTISPECIES: aspartyl-phosphate phosphatase Spo0E family protein [unclassified Candidatus Frackibacter]